MHQKQPVRPNGRKEGNAGVEGEQTRSLLAESLRQLQPVNPTYLGSET